MSRHKKPVPPKPKKMETDPPIPQVIRAPLRLTPITRGVKQAMFDMRRDTLMRKQMEILNQQG